MTISNAMSICHSKGTKVYGVNKLGKMYVEVSKPNTPNPTKSKKHHSSHKNLNDAVGKTYLHYARELNLSNAICLSL